MYYARRYVCCSACFVSNKCDESNLYLVRPIGAHGDAVMYFGSFYFRGELHFLNCDDICMCIVNNKFKLLEFVFNYSVYVDLKYNQISLTFTSGSVCVCVVCSYVVVIGLPVWLYWYPMWWVRWLL